MKLNPLFISSSKLKLFPPAASKERKKKRKLSRKGKGSLKTRGYELDRKWTIIIHPYQLDVNLKIATRATPFCGRALENDLQILTALEVMPRPNPKAISYSRPCLIKTSALPFPHKFPISSCIINPFPIAQASPVSLFSRSYHT